MDGMIIYKYGKLYIMLKVFYHSRLNLESLPMTQISPPNHLEKFSGIHSHLYYSTSHLYWLNLLLYMKIHDSTTTKNHSFKNVG